MPTLLRQLPSPTKDAPGCWEAPWTGYHFIYSPKPLHHAHENIGKPRIFKTNFFFSAYEGDSCWFNKIQKTQKNTQEKNHPQS